MPQLLKPLLLLTCFIAAEEIGVFVSGNATFEHSYGTLGLFSPDTVKSGNLYLLSGLLPMLISRPSSQPEQTPPLAERVTGEWKISPLTGLSIAIRATDSGSGIREVRFCYKNGGEADFRSDILYRDNGLYTKSIPGNLLSEKGFSYFFEIRDSVGNGTFLPDTALDSLSLMLHLPQGVKYHKDNNRFFPSEKWTMFSFPLLPDQSTAATLLTSQLGPHDERHWKMVRWDGNAYRTLSQSDLFRLRPGHAFFLFVRQNNVTLSSGSGCALRLDRPYRLSLPPKQWTQFGNPFAFPIRFSYFSPSQPDSLSQPLDGDYAEQGYTPLETNPLIQPWKGYWIFNSSSTICTLAITPVEDKNPSKKGIAFPDTIDWAGTLSTEKGSKIFFGTSSIRKMAFPQPPTLENGPVLSFRCDNSRFISQFKQTAKNGEGICLNDLILETRQEKMIKLQTTSMGRIPHKRLLFDKTRLVGLPLPDSGIVIVSNPEGDKERCFSLFCGSKHFVDSLMQWHTKSCPMAVEISDNIPNPFNPTTSFHIALPARTTLFQVEATIFDLAGHYVRRLIDTALLPGRHTVIWQGKDDQGRSVASGVYLCRFTVSGKQEKLGRILRLTLIR